MKLVTKKSAVSYDLTQKSLEANKTCDRKENLFAKQYGLIGQVILELVRNVTSLISRRIIWSVFVLFSDGMEFFSSEWLAGCYVLVLGGKQC